MLFRRRNEKQLVTNKRDSTILKADRTFGKRGESVWSRFKARKIGKVRRDDTTKENNTYLILLFLHSILSNEQLFKRVMLIILVLSLVIFVFIRQINSVVSNVLDAMVTLIRWYTVGGVSGIFSGSLLKWVTQWLSSW